MLYVICGDDTYRSRKKLHELTHDPALIGEGGVLQCDASLEDIAEIVEGALSSGNLFGISQAIVIMHPVSGKTENYEWLLARCATLAETATPVILWDAVPATPSAQKKKSPRRSKTVRGIEEFCAQAKKAFEYETLTNSALHTYILTMADESGVALSPKDATMLAEECAGDLWRVHNELEKYTLTGSFDYEKKVRVVEKLYDFMDSLALGDGARAFTLLESIKESGFEDPYILATLAGSLRNMIKVKAILPTNPDYAKLGEFGMHEFVLKKTLSHIRRFRLEDLKRLYRMIAEADVLTKTSDIDSGMLYARIIAAFEHQTP